MEKTLLTGFGIVTLILFLSFLSPFFSKINDFNTNEKDEVDNYSLFMEEIDHLIKFVIANPNTNPSSTIEYPKNLNVTFIDEYAVYKILLDDEVHENVLRYDGNFSRAFYSNPPTEDCRIDVSIHYNLIIVLISPRQ